MFIRQILLSLSLSTLFFGSGLVLAQTPRPELRIGSTGAAVGELQTTLRLLGYYSGEATGTYDEATVIAVYQFQRAADIPQTGVMDRATWEALLPATNANPPSAAANSATAPEPEEATPETQSRPTTDTSTAATTAPVTATTPANQTPVAATTTTDNPDPSSLPLLKEGMDGDAVKLLQTRLQALGHYRGAIDGIFGPNTRIAVIAAQTALKIDGDGIVGAQTWAKLLAQ